MRRGKNNAAKQTACSGGVHLWFNKQGITFCKSMPMHNSLNACKELINSFFFFFSVQFQLFKKELQSVRHLATILQPFCCSVPADTSVWLISCFSLLPHFSRPPDHNHRHSGEMFLWCGFWNLAQFFFAWQRFIHFHALSQSCSQSMIAVWMHLNAEFGFLCSAGFTMTFSDSALILANKFNF